MQSAAMKRMIAVRTALILDEPFWGTLALRLKLEEDPSCETAWVDGHTLGFNPTFIQELPTHATAIALFAHEVAHCVLGHPWRRDARDADGWNEACDRAINPMLRDARFHLPEGCLLELEPSHHGKSAEWIYNRLPKAAPTGTPQQSNSSSPEGGDGGAEQQPSSGGDDNQDAEGTGEQDAVPGSDTKPPPFGGEVRDAPSAPDDDADAPTEDQWKQAVQQAAKLAQGQGKLPGELARLADRAAQPRVDWRSVLRRFVQEIAQSDYSWTQPNRRYLAQGMYLPALYNRELGPLLVAIDTSGSIDKTLLAVFGAELQAVAEELQPRNIHVVYCDAKIQHEETFERNEPVELHPRGGGGTDFRPVFAALEGLEEQPVCVVYLTDLQGTFPPAEADPGVPVLWVAPQRNARLNVPFGEVVTVDE